MTATIELLKSRVDRLRDELCDMGNDDIQYELEWIQEKLTELDESASGLDFFLAAYPIFERMEYRRGGHVFGVSEAEDLETLIDMFRSWRANNDLL